MSFTITAHLPPLKHTVGGAMHNGGVYIDGYSWVGESVRVMFLTVVSVINEYIDMCEDGVPRERHYD